MIYVLVMVLLLGGIGFVLYQNQNLTGQNDNPPVGTAVAGDQAAPSQPLAADRKNNQGLDLTIFSSQKFQELKENVLIYQEDSGLGKRDLFKSN